MRPSVALPTFGPVPMISSRNQDRERNRSDRKGSRDQRAHRNAGQRRNLLSRDVSTLVVLRLPQQYDDGVDHPPDDEATSRYQQENAEYDSSFVEAVGAKVAEEYCQNHRDSPVALTVLGRGELNSWGRM